MQGKWNLVVTDKENQALKLKYSIILIFVEYIHPGMQLLLQHFN
jgi:hypothetical protein